jgi:hypothetical protein
MGGLTTFVTSFTLFPVPVRGSSIPLPRSVCSEPRQARPLATAGLIFCIDSQGEKFNIGVEGSHLLSEPCGKAAGAFWVCGISCLAPAVLFRR